MDTPTKEVKKRHKITIVQGLDTESDGEDSTRPSNISNSPTSLPESNAIAPAVATTSKVQIRAAKQLISSDNSIPASQIVAPSACNDSFETDDENLCKLFSLKVIDLSLRKKEESREKTKTKQKNVGV